MSSVTATLIGLIAFPSTTLAPSAHTCGPLLSSSFPFGGVFGSLSSSRSPIVGFVVSFALPFVTVTFTSFVIVSSVGLPSLSGAPVPVDLIVTLIVTSLLVSPSPNSTFGVPVRFPFASTLSPSFVSDVIVVFGLFGVTTLVSAGTSFPFSTDVDVTLASSSSLPFGFVSLSSVMPSLSSSGSVVSGIPSPSVSL